MSDLILKTQLEVLGKNLRRLQNFSDFLEQRRSERISRLLSSLKGDESIEVSIDKIYKKMFEIIVNYDKFLREKGAKDIVKELAADETFLREEIRKARDHIDAVKDNVEMMQDPTVSQEEGLRKIAGAEFEEKANQLIGIIDEIKQMVDEASKAEKEGRIQEAENKRREAWNKYSDQVHRQSQNLFTEYVDFMRGLAMRDAGLDEGICQIVDQLVSTWTISNVSHSFSIPDRYEAVSMTLSRIIRIGFPEWTIWAVPLAVHELGHIAVEENAALKEFVEQNADEQNRHSLREILCDAFATYVMGPAYACATILLRFNPLSEIVEGDGQTSEAKRVHVILGMLDWMSPSDKPYGKIIQILKKEWKEAMKQAGKPADLKSTDQEKLDNWMAKGREKIKNTTSGYAATSHTRADKLQGEFMEQGTNIKPKDFTDDFLIVLNAAWIGRTYYPEKADDIEKAACSLWNQIVKGRRGGRQALAGYTRPGG